MPRSARSSSCCGSAGSPTGAPECSHWATSSELSLARALLHRPQLLILDEPTNALDPTGIVEIRELLRSRAGEQGVTVFVSSHILGEIAQLVDRVGIMHEGHLLEELDRGRLRAAEREFVDVGVSEPQRAATILAAAGFVRVERTDGRLRVFDARDRVAELARALVGAGLDLTELTPAHEDLESALPAAHGRRRMTFAHVLATEFLKLRRSKVTWLTLAALSIGPLAIALMMWIVREPGRAAKLGLLGTKANLSGLTATWPSYFSMLTLVVGMGGMLLLSFVVAYIFGREYTEGTAKNLLALPVGRHWFALAKLVVAAAWWAVLVVAVLVEALVLGAALRLPDFSATLAARSVRDALLAAAIAYLLVPVVAWIALLGRGYLPPLGFALAMLALGDLFSHTGWAAWFPWSIVPLFIGTIGQRVTTVAPGSVVVVALTFLAGTAATIAQLRWADNAQ